MLITDRFNYLHIPKTAGSKTRSLLLSYGTNSRTNNIIYNAAEGQGGAAMHTHVIPKEYNQNKRPTAMGFRRLKDLILSHNSFFLYSRLSNRFDVELWDKAKEHTLQGEIYDWLNVSPGQFMRVDDAYKDFLAVKDVTYLRAEFILEDVYYWLQSLDMIVDEDAIFKDTKRVNGSKFPQPNLFDKDDSIMYNNNPLWANLEKELYES